MDTKTKQQTARALMATVATKQEWLDVYDRESQQMLYEAEQAKTHALVDHRMAEPQFDQFCEFMMDGGGVSDDTMPTVDEQSLMGRLWQAIFDRDQAVVWKELPHLVKSRALQLGLIAVVPGTNGTVIRGVRMQSPAEAAALDGPDAPDKSAFVAAE